MGRDFCVDQKKLHHGSFGKMDERTRSDRFDDDVLGDGVTRRFALEKPRSCFKSK